MNKKLIFVSSRLRGDIPTNIKIAECLCHIVILKGHVPLAPHTIFTRYLDDTNEKERELGIACGFELLRICDEIWVFNFDGISQGMQQEIDLAEQLGKPVRYFGEKVELIKNL